MWLVKALPLVGPVDLFFFHFLSILLVPMSLQGQGAESGVPLGQLVRDQFLGKGVNL